MADQIMMSLMTMNFLIGWWLMMLTMQASRIVKADPHEATISIIIGNHLMQSNPLLKFNSSGGANIV